MNQKNRNERKSGVPAEKSAGVDNTQTQFTYNFEEGEEQNREEGEMTQKKLGGGRNRRKKLGGERKCEINV